MTQSTTPEPVRLLWTGGWDSTFRLVELISRAAVDVLPHYVVDPNRKSWKVELETRRRIEDACAGRGFPGRILPSVLIEMDDLRPSRQMTSRYESLRRRGHLGRQYEWLAALGEGQNSSGLELTIHRDDKAHIFLEHHVEAGQDEHGERVWRLKAGAPDDLLLFQSFSFPLFDLTKTAMARTARQRGFEDLMELTWFCCSPIRQSRACGVCNPCAYTIQEGLSRRVGWRGLLRYHTLRRAKDLVPPTLKVRIKQTFHVTQPHHATSN